ncbi:MAG TPA: adenylate/guanylate cyclase domain-containing protein [Candidatus Limnocylindrales bacterium]
MDDGDEREFGPSDVIDIPPGHDSWVTGDEPVVLLDVSGNVSDFALPTSRARTVLSMVMTDIVESTQTAARIGDPAWRQRLGDHNRVVRIQIERFGGREISTTGDGFLAAFGSADAALRAAIAIRDAAAAVGVQIRTGVHTGEVDLVDEDLRGIAVHETARIMAAAPGGSVYASGLPRALARGGGLQFTSVGTRSLKGFDEPVELFEVTVPA